MNVNTETHLLVGICGGIRSGKDTVAKHLAEEHGFTVLSLGDGPKDAAIETFGVEPHHVYGTQEQKNEPIEHLGVISADVPRAFGGEWIDRVGHPWTGRFLTEFMGTEVGRLVSRSVWVDRVMNRIDCEREFAKLPPAGVVYHVIPDIRFPNEVDAVLARGGVIWRTHCLDRPAERTGHESDSYWPAFYVHGELRANHGDLRTLYSQANIALAEYRDLAAQRQTPMARLS